MGSILARVVGATFTKFMVCPAPNSKPYPTPQNGRPATSHPTPSPNSPEECAWSMPDDACMGHAHDTVVYCTGSARASAPQGAVRLIAPDGSPSIDGVGRPEIFMDNSWSPICSSGVSSGTAGVICKSMGFSGSSGSAKCSGGGCGDVAPAVSELSCSGAESGPLACPHEAGDDVFCAPSESLVVTCAGDGETQGRPAKESALQLSM